jgi:hypothetical protein
MAKAKNTGVKKSVQQRRETTLSHLAGEYQDALHYTVELRRAIDGFKGPIPDDSPHRYLRLDVGDAILAYLTRVGASSSSKSGKSIKELVAELESGGCIFGRIKSPTEIVTKAVKAYIQSGRLVWVDPKQTRVGLPSKKG